MHNGPEVIQPHVVEEIPKARGVAAAGRCSSATASLVPASDLSMSSDGVFEKDFERECDIPFLFIDRAVDDILR